MRNICFITSIYKKINYFKKLIIIMVLSNSIFTFFKELKLNNNREWFLKNKSTFKEYEVLPL